MTTQPISIINDNGTPRVDSRLVAGRLNVQHKNLIENISKYTDEFQML
ncbi:hypothetical protein THIOM_003752, partial [Candidatus Thiomargarita nelsonii]